VCHFMNVTCAVCDSDRVKRVRKKFAARYNQVPVVIKNSEMPSARHATKNSSPRNNRANSRDGLRIAFAKTLVCVVGADRGNVRKVKIRTL
jgi:hypothetical protein